MDKVINVLHVNSADLLGRRFNGYDLIDDLKPYGIKCSLITLEKKSNNGAVHQLLTSNKELLCQNIITQHSIDYSFDKTIYPWAEKIISSSEFSKCDIIHLHLIHNNLISFLDIKRIAALKPTVWTWHDPWPLTGHCIHPLDCDLWKSGCEVCPHLNYQFLLNNDTSKNLWKAKFLAAQNSPVHIVYASNFMKNLAFQSPIGRNFRHQHKIPFGIQVPNSTSLSKKTSREQLSIGDDETVIFFRHDDVILKGTYFILEALRLIEDTSNITLLTVGPMDLPDDITNRYKTIQNAWTDNEEDFFNIFNAADIFVMPSLAESFGLMALEAMALSIPVIVFKGTALEEIVDPPNCGLAAEYRSATSLAEKIILLANDKTLRKKMGASGKFRQANHFSKDSYLNNLVALYRSIPLFSAASDPQKLSPLEHAAKLAENFDRIASDKDIDTYEVHYKTMHDTYYAMAVKEPTILILKKLHIVGIFVWIKKILKKIYWHVNS